MSQVTGVHAITFHPDGRTLFSGFDDNLKVWLVSIVNCNQKIFLQKEHKHPSYMFINCRSIHGSLLFVMIVLIWDGQHLVISALTTESFWVAHFIEIVSEFGWLMCRYFLWHFTVSLHYCFILQVVESKFTIWVLFPPRSYMFPSWVSACWALWNWCTWTWSKYLHRGQI